MGNREKILAELEDGPLSFSELKRRTGLENGTLQHHIESTEAIEKARGAVMLSEECSDCKFDPMCRGDCIRKSLEKPRKREILELLDEGLQQSEIAERLDLTRATVSYHVSDLKEKGLIKDGEVVEKVSEEISE